MVLTETIARLTGFTGRIAWDTRKPNGQSRRKLDASRAQERFGFASTTLFKAHFRLISRHERGSVKPDLSCVVFRNVVAPSARSA